MSINKSLTLKLQGLADMRNEVVALPSDEALDRILEASEPAALVHSFSAQDLHLLVHDIGLERALPILRLASNRQWEYFLDVEGWYRDRMDLDAITHWAHLLLTADPIRLARWVGGDKADFFEYYLFKNIRVLLKEHDQDPSDFGAGYFTLDGMFYIHILDHPTDKLSEEDGDVKHAFGQTRRRLINDILKHLADEDPVRFHQILLEAMHVIPAEVEEAAYRRRNVRMAEKGFLPFDEAVGIYQSLTVKALKGRSASQKEFRPSVDVQQPVMRFAARLADGQDPVMKALEKFKSESERLGAEVELAGLANRLIVADQKLIRDRMDLKVAVRKACGYIQIGLTALAMDMGGSRPDPEQSAGLMSRYSLPSLFQIGFGYAMRLKWRAEKWYHQSWVRKQELMLTFFDEMWMGVLGGLLLKKPRFFDESLRDQYYRDFVAMEDIVRTDTILDRMIAMDAFLSRIGIDLELQQPANVPLTYKNLMLTFWAKDCLGLSRTLSPIEVPLFHSFFSKQLFESQKQVRPVGSSNVNTETEALTIRLGAKRSFLNWLISQSGFSEAEIIDRIGLTLDDLFSEIESELRRVEPDNIDARFVTLFLLK